MRALLTGLGKFVGVSSEWVDKVKYGGFVKECPGSAEWGGLFRDEFGK